MERFNYKRLDGLFVPGTDYLRALQAHALKLEEELQSLREARSKDGNRFYQSEAKQDKSENRALYKQIGQLEGKIAMLEGKQAGDLERVRGEYEGKLKQQELQHRAKVEELEKRIEILQNNQVVEVFSDEKKQDFRMVDRERDKKGRLIPTGSSKEDRKKMCFRLIELEGMSPEDAAATVGNLSPASAKVYCSEYKKDRKRKVEALEKKKKDEIAYAEYLDGLSENIGLSIEHESVASINRRYNYDLNLW